MFHKLLITAQNTTGYVLAAPHVTELKPDKNILQLLLIILIKERILSYKEDVGMICYISDHYSSVILNWMHVRGQITIC